MGKRDSRIDAYIAKAAPFARPILTEIRERVHAACPEVEETMKWSSPHFDYKGMMCGMSAFKEHCTFGFWKSPLILGPSASRDPAGQFGRLTRVSDLPPQKVFKEYVRKAMELNEAGITLERPKRSPRPLEIPDYFTSAVKKNRKAWAAFEAFSPSHRREYVEWITEAKTAATRERRLAQAIEWMAEGKPRNWKYM